MTMGIVSRRRPSVAWIASLLTGDDHVYLKLD